MLRIKLKDKYKIKIKRRLQVFLSFYYDNEIYKIFLISFFDDSKRKGDKLCFLLAFFQFVPPYLMKKKKKK